MGGKDSAVGICSRKERFPPSVAIAAIEVRGAAGRAWVHSDDGETSFSRAGDAREAGGAVGRPVGRRVRRPCPPEDFLRCPFSRCQDAGASAGKGLEADLRGREAVNAGLAVGGEGAVPVSKEPGGGAIACPRRRSQVEKAHPRRLRGSPRSAWSTARFEHRRMGARPPAGDMRRGPRNPPGRRRGVERSALRKFSSAGGMTSVRVG